MTTGNHPFIKILLFLQIFNKAVGKNGESGWEFMPFIYSKARNTNYSFTLDEAKRDFFYRALCEFTGKDYRRFCKAWGIQISTLARQEMSALYPPLDKAIWTYNPLTNSGGEDVIIPKEDIDVSEWTIVAKSTEEPTGEGANNGQAIRLIDGDVNTFWHSQWAAATASLPHSITFGLKSNEIVKGFYLVPRQNSSGQRPRSVEIQISKDNVNYTTLTQDDLEEGYSFTMANTADRKEFRLKQSQEIRYVRIFFRENNHSGNSHHALAEFGAFYDVD
ncbi:discoidin domain-containing protein [Sphingobacterium sp. T2]|nr:discoidin domain-containing protein [Sphingobacterium sp. T2]